MSNEDYARGWQDGIAERDPDPARCNGGANHVNDYERGYIDGGTGDAPQRWPDGWTAPTTGGDETDE